MLTLVTGLLSNPLVWIGAAVAALLGGYKLKATLAARKASRAEARADTAAAGQVVAKAEAKALQKQKAALEQVQAIHRKTEEKDHEIETSDDPFGDLDRAFDDFNVKLRSRD